MDLAYCAIFIISTINRYVVTTVTSRTNAQTLKKVGSKTYEKNALQENEFISISSFIDVEMHCYASSFILVYLVLSFHVFTLLDRD